MVAPLSKANGRRPLEEPAAVMNESGAVSDQRRRRIAYRLLTVN